jgi:hypothetical protein
MATGLLEPVVLSTAPPHFITEQQLAARWNVVPRTIQRMVRDGELRPLLVRRAPRFALADIEAYEARRLAPTAITPQPLPLGALAAPQPPPRIKPPWAGQQPYVVCIAHRKGGVAKTTTTWYLAREIARAGKRVLLRDCDPQAGLRDILRGHGVEDGRFSRRIVLVDADEPAPFTPDVELIDTPPCWMSVSQSCRVPTHCLCLSFQSSRRSGHWDACYVPFKQRPPTTHFCMY